MRSCRVLRISSDVRKVHHHDGMIWAISINRPERRNAVDRITAAALKSVFQDFDKDATARVAILHGEGGNFCAGADLQAIASGKQELRNSTSDLGPIGPTALTLTKPVIAAVEGFAVAGGLELAVWCDLRIASKSSIFGVFCRRFGVPLIDGGTVRLPRIIGHGRAMDMILTGRAVGSDEALSIGLVNRVVENGHSLDASIALAKELCAFPQSCMRNDRLSAIHQWGAPLHDALKAELFQYGHESMKTLDPSQAASVFVQSKKKEPSTQFRD